MAYGCSHMHPDGEDCNEYTSSHDFDNGANKYGVIVGLAAQNPES